MENFMKTVGIIAEYNPFHNGHAYQIRYAKEKLGADYVVIAMSGDYVQRGTPALLPKHLRAKMALLGGADLILELPAAFSTASAEFFAKGGVSLLDGLGVVDELCFGSEAGEISTLSTIAEILADEPDFFRCRLKEKLRDGMTYPAARMEALTEYLMACENAGEETLAADVLSSPNNILGVEYCKTILQQKSAMQPVTLKREGSGYHTSEIKQGAYPSASALRKMLTAAKSEGGISAVFDSSDTLSSPSVAPHSLAGLIPDAVLPLFEKSVSKGAFLTENDLNILLHYRLLSETPESLCEYADLSPDLARRMINQRNHFQSFEQFTSLLKTKEMTQTRIQRALLHMLLNIREVPKSVPYARILGFRKDSAALLGAIKKRGTIPLLTKLADASALLDESAEKLLDETTFASNIYQSLLAPKTGEAFVHEYRKEIVIV